MSFLKKIEKSPEKGDFFMFSLIKSDFCYHFAVELFIFP